MSCPTLAGDSNVARAGAARRRRERRLRSMLRHERQTVAMELAAALHHSRDVGPGKYDGLRAQTTASSGTRPEPLEEVSEPQGLSAAPRCPDAGVPLLSVPLLAGRDGIDDTSVRWLLKAALKKKKEEEEEKKVQERKERVMQEIHRKVRADEAVTDAEWAAWKEWRGIGSSSSGGQKRKRKKRRKRKLPRNSSCPRLAARHLGRYGPEGHLMPRHIFRFCCPRCTHLETWTFYEPLVSGTLFGACHAGGAQENLEFSGCSLRGIISSAPCFWQSLVRCILRPFE